jgi:hypothetical protein
MNWYKRLKPWQQGLIGVASFLPAAWLIGWLLGPEFLEFDEARCGVEALFGIDCTPRFKP